MSSNETMNGHIRPASPAPAVGNTQPADDQFDAAAALLRLMVGAVLVGEDELRIRLREWETNTRSTAQAAPARTASDVLRSSFVGMLFETETRMRRGFSTLLERLAFLSDEANLFYTRLTPYLRQTPLDPLRMRLDDILFLAMVTLDRWTERGWIEEQQGRRMARQGTVGMIDELLDYMAHNPEVRRLIEQQGISMADTAVDEVRERTAAADMWLERLAHSLLRRQTGDKAAKPAGSVEASPPAGRIQAPLSAT